MPDLREKIAAAVRDRIGLRPEVELVLPGSLPRFELKAKRFFKIS
jgi:phenylacetate-CoA ligase